MRILLIVYDNDSYIHTFPQGIAYISSALLNAGHTVDIYSQDIHHYPEEHLTAHIEAGNYDVVGLSFIGGYYQYRKAIKISAAVNRARKHFKYYILGGHGPSPEPEFFIRKLNADIVVIGEGEETIVDLMQAVERGDNLSNVAGIAFRGVFDIFRTEKRKQIKGVDSIPWPAYHLFDINYYRLLRQPHCTNGDFVMPVLSGRGCPFRCNFCYRMDEGFRPRSNTSILEEMEYLKAKHGITYIEFTDELLMSSKQRTIEFCDELINSGLNLKWSCNGRLNFASRDVLQRMKEAGCQFINYGIESYNDDILKVMNKSLTTKQIREGIENTLSVGISPGFNIIFGNIGETREHLNNSVDFLIEYDDGAQLRTIRPVTPYPGSALYYKAIEDGLIAGPEDFYENKHLNSDLLAVNFTPMTDDDFYECLTYANDRLLSHYHERAKSNIKKQLDKLYGDKDTSFRGFRQT